MWILTGTIINCVMSINTDMIELFVLILINSLSEVFVMKPNKVYSRLQEKSWLLIQKQW